MTTQQNEGSGFRDQHNQIVNKEDEEDPRSLVSVIKEKEEG
jgi:hypothetical protein